ncbi:GNAT family N-acetyltransferase [Nocardiopsis ansamitocini]|uniref:GNAT family N-acetyltransferase n=1 Tax=Nocardiopsis ansamitocini TaxID=1670832 RepID=UPI00255320A6|nr:GNAT family N-acetyltransferase [Nocardiopsis ansamitocini]
MNPDPIWPSVILETDRLVLRAFTADDVDDVYRAANDPVTQRWVPLPEPGRRPYTRSDAEEWCTVIAPHMRASGDGQQWAVVIRDTGEFAGAFGLVRTLWRARTTEIGYWTAPWVRGKGVATEAVAVIARWALLEQSFERVEIKAATANTASRRVAEKTGFLYEGTERSAMPLHEGRVDLAVYGLVRADLTHSDS